MLQSVEQVCAMVLSRVEAKLYSLRYVVEAFRPRVPRGLLNALCLGVLRNYRLLGRGLRYCGY
ncbi:MAG TPA: RsmB/NOP family class I SAM-dependent RNA methyltransferase, partial [Pyrodictium sp.]|nr:RsmB/NOP family class I SAM-dependent RNA methyltransferase [Pyrodictium sp.]